MSQSNHTSARLGRSRSEDATREIRREDAARIEARFDREEAIDVCASARADRFVHVEHRVLREVEASARVEDARGDLARERPERPSVSERDAEVERTTIR